MTSRELTSGFDFWSRGHLRMAVMHLLIKFSADIFIQCGVIDILPKLKMAAATILDLLGVKKGKGACYENLLLVWHLCSVPNWVQIYAMVTEIDALMLQTFI